MNELLAMYQTQIFTCIAAGFVAMIYVCLPVSIQEKIKQAIAIAKIWIKRGK